jgi:hypothetical protein
MVEEIIPARREVVRHVQHEGQCVDCGHTQWGALPPELGPAPVLGASVLNLVLSLRFSFGLSWLKVARYLKEHVGLTVSPGGLCQLVQRAATRTQPLYQVIRDKSLTRPFLHLDETSWYENGKQLWAWIVTHPELSLFHVEEGRGKDVAEALLTYGLLEPSEELVRYQGIAITDFLGSYTALDWVQHQYCWPHLLRDAHQAAELSPCPRTVGFLEKLSTIYHDGVAVQAGKGGGLTVHGIRVRMGRLAHDVDLAEVPEVAVLQKRIRDRFDGLLTFVTVPGLPASNNQAERDIRFLVLLRKTSFTTRSLKGTEALCHWLSVVQTARKQNVPLGPLVIQALAAHHQPQAPPPRLFLN